jgi:hypothetical protein
MPKFYVQSGSFQMVVQAHDSRCAAIWAVHRTLRQSLGFLCDEPQERCESVAGRFADTICVSERGFDLVEADEFETLAIVNEWNQLLVALERIQQRFAIAEPAAR